jgi:AbrB family looped-hinge helix DNA binding protein
LGFQYVTFIINDIMMIYVMDGNRVKTRINENGRIVIPAEIREELGIRAGDELVLTLEGGVLQIEPQRNRIKRVQESLQRLIPAQRVLSDELVADRREEAAREMEDWIG